jgi:hypothetical protein
MRCPTQSSCSGRRHAAASFTPRMTTLSEGARCQLQGIEFSGVVYAHQRRVAIRDCIEDLELIAKVCEPEDLRNKVYFLPLRR